MDPYVQGVCFTATLQGLCLGAGYTAFSMTDAYFRGLWPTTPQERTYSRTRLMGIIGKEALRTGLSTSALVVAFAAGSGVVQASRNGYRGDAWDTATGAFTACMLHFRGDPWRVMVGKSLAGAAVGAFGKLLFLRGAHPVGPAQTIMDRKRT